MCSACKGVLLTIIWACGLTEGSEHTQCLDSELAEFTLHTVLIPMTYIFDASECEQDEHALQCCTGCRVQLHLNAATCLLLPSAQETMFIALVDNRTGLQS